MHRRTFIAATLGGMAGAAAADTDVDQLPLHSDAALAFGTTISVAVRHADPEAAQQAVAAALGEARRVDALMSLHQPPSQVFRLNRDKVLHGPDPHLLAVLERLL